MQRTNDLARSVRRLDEDPGQSPFQVHTDDMTEQHQNTVFDHPVLLDWWKRTKQVILAAPIMRIFPDVQKGFERYWQLMDQHSVSPCLDVGGGRGEAAFTVVNKGGYSVTLDRSRTQCALLKEKYPGLAVVRGDANRLPFKDQTFRTTSYRLVIHHLRNPVQAMLEARRVSRESVILDVIADNRPLLRWIQKVWLLVQDDRARLLDERKWKSLMKAAGAFEVNFEHGGSIHYFLFAHVHWFPPDGEVANTIGLKSARGGDSNPATDQMPIE